MNMGATSLIVVDPQCDIDIEANRSAAGAQQLLEHRETLLNVEDFFSEHLSGIKIALTRRTGKLRTEGDLEDRLRILVKDDSIKSQLNSGLYLIFGPEDHGLSNADMSRVHFSCQIPTYGSFPSLNLSQAVLISLYITQSCFHHHTRPTGPFDAPLEAESFAEFPSHALREWLELIGFNLSAKRRNAFLTLQRLLLRNTPTPEEASLLNKVIYQTVRKLKSPTD